jgi:hypothetical protein
LNCSGWGTTLIFFLPTRTTKYILQFTAWLIFLLHYLASLTWRQLVALTAGVIVVVAAGYWVALPTLVAGLGMLGAASQDLLAKISLRVSQRLAESSE